MPVVATFAGMVIKIYFLDAEHNPPHVHCEYGEFAAAIDIKTLQILDGFLPTKKYQLASKWIGLHQADLLDIWESQQFRKLPPL